MEQDANKLMELLARKAQTQINTSSSMRFTNADKVVESLAELEHRRKRQEELLSRHMSASPSTNRSSSYDQYVLLIFRGLRAHDASKQILRTGQWQDRAKLLWQLAEYTQSLTGSQGRPSCQFALTDAETLDVLIAALDDSSTQVFVAGCAFFRALLTALPYFQDTVASKNDLAEIMKCLLERLNSREAPTRNAVAFTILTVAGSTRTRRTFVTHLLLKHVESRHFQPPDQQLLALLKLLTALLSSFHCCASLDIAPRQIIRLLLLSDADQHEDALIREAAKQLVLALCNDIGEKNVLF